MRVRQFRTATQAFGSSKETTEMTGTCTGCGKPINKDYTECYACHFYGKRSYAQIRAKRSDTNGFEQVHEACGESIGEDSTETHTCQAMPTITQVRKARSKVRSSKNHSAVRTIRQPSAGLRRYDGRVYKFQGF